MSDSTLHCIASIPEDKQVAWVGTEEIVVTPVVDSAKTLLDQLTVSKPESVSEKCNHQALLSHSAMLLKQPEFRFEEFLSWVQRASPKGQIQLNQPFWTRAGWGVLANGVKNSDVLTTINRYLATFRDPTRASGERVAAICEIYKVVVDAVESHGQRTPIAWLRLCMALVTGQCCTPLMVTTTGGIKTGTSLPVLVSLTDPDRKRPRQAGYVSFHDDPSNPYVPPALREDLHHFRTGALAWNGDWARSFKIGLGYAKSLWKTQFSRLDDAARMLEVKNKCMRVDLSFANLIATRAYDNESYTLEGMSATAYWLQVSLGLLLPGSAVPDGVATGLVDDRNGEFALRYVEEIPAKLIYATGAGLIGRIVLPSDDETRKAIEAYISDAEVRVSLLERNLCSTARTAADAMQSSGWRRANFLATPEVRYGFSTMLQRLFDLQKANGSTGATKDQDTLSDHDPLSDADVTAGSNKKPRPLTPHEIKSLNRVRRWLVSDKPEHRITFAPRSELDEALLGKTLAWIDEGVRNGSRPPDSRAHANGEVIDPYPAPGLGVLCVRTREGEPDMRFWANVFQILDVNPRLWREFQWADLDQAAAILAKVLNNFVADPAISAAPPPDLLVILDDAGLTRRALTRLFPERFDGKLLQLLKPFKAHAENPLTHKLRAMPHRQDWLYETRIAVIWPNNERANALDTYDAAQAALDEHKVEDSAAPNAAITYLDFDRLRIFRYGFSIHSAYAVLNHSNDISLEWTAVRERLKAWQGEGKLRYHRGEYYIQERLRVDESSLRHKHGPDLHLAAALSMAPMLEPTRAFSAINRDRAFEPEPFGEALWHCHRALRSPNGTRINERARRCFATLGYLQANPHWDTWRVLSFNSRTHAEDAWGLACLLLADEFNQTGASPHPDLYANAIYTLANSTGIPTSKESLTLYEAAQKLFDQVNGQCFHKNHLNDAGIRLYSMFAFFLIRLLRVAPNGTCQKQLVEIEGHLDNSVSVLLKNWYRTDPRFFPFAHGWLESKWSDAKRSNADRFNFALIGCRIEERPVAQSWIEMLTLLKPSTPGIEINDVVDLAHLWESARFDKSRLSFDIATRFHGRDREKRHVVLWNLLWWLALHKGGGGKWLVNSKLRETLLDLTKTLLHKRDWIYLAKFLFNPRNPIHVTALQIAAELTDILPGKKALPSAAVQDFNHVRKTVLTNLSQLSQASEVTLPMNSNVIVKELSLRGDLAGQV